MVGNFTAAQTGFVPRLIEKDYFCTVALDYLAASTVELVFRGGTCLAKLHAAFDARDRHGLENLEGHTTVGLA